MVFLENGVIPCFISAANICECIEDLVMRKRSQGEEGVEITITISPIHRTVQHSTKWKHSANH